MDTQSTIDKALAFLAREQQPDGSFVSFSSPTLASFKPAYTYRTTFVPSLILAALGSVDAEPAKAIRANLAAFLITQKSSHWSYNYWVRDSQETQLMPYPDDLDDTFCALSALWLHDTQLVDETALAHMAKQLIRNEVHTGGPYRTWLTTDSDVVWRDVDIAVNANIQYFLSLVAGPLPNVTNHIEQAITAKMLTSPYYPNIFPIAYFVARSYTGPLQKELALQLIDTPRMAPLQTALTITALTRLGSMVSPDMIRELLTTQNVDGSWPAAAFCIDPQRDDDTTYYHGAPALTTAFAIEALRSTQVHSTFPQPVKRHMQNTSLFTNVTQRATQELTQLGPNLRPVSLVTLKKTISSNHSKEIILLADMTQRALKKPHILPDQLLSRLGLANLYGWMAYTIYDDFLDGEGHPPLLGLANVTLRRSLQTFVDALPQNDTFQRLILQTFDKMDDANTWEVQRCRCVATHNELTLKQLPAYQSTLQLANRSLGHTLTPIGVLMSNGATHKQIYTVQTALRHYIAARQLNDDAHDWREDLCTGRMTYVVTMLMRGIDAHTGQHTVDELLPRAEQYFWHTALPLLCEKISRHITSSRRLLRQSDLFVPDNQLESLLQRIEESVIETKNTIHQTKKFLQAYKNPE